jgi:hypothetical protein
MPKIRAVVMTGLAAILAFAGGWTIRSASLPDPPSRSLPGRDAVPLEGIGDELRDILLRPDMVERVAGTAALLSRVGPESLDAVLAAYDGVALDVTDIELVLLAEWWASFDPEAAFVWSALGWRGEHPWIRDAIFRAWGRSDPKVALMRAGTAMGNRMSYMRAVMIGWDESGQPGLFETVRGLGTSTERQTLIDAMVRRRMTRDGVESTMRWAEALPEDQDSFRLNVFQRVASAAAEIDPERAAGWASQHAESADGWDLPRRVGVRWARRNPRAAMAWLATLPPSRGRDIGVRETYLAFLRAYRKDALAYVAEATVEPWLDPAISLYAKAIMSDRNRTPEALDWAARISDPELRDTTTILVVRAWLLEDEPAAEAWIEQAELSDVVRRKIREIPPRQRRLADERKARQEGSPWAPPLPED